MSLVEMQSLRSVWDCGRGRGAEETGIQRGLCAIGIWTTDLNGDCFSVIVPWSGTLRDLEVSSWKLNCDYGKCGVLMKNPGVFVRGARMSSGRLVSTGW
jgi:hypothetical protein